MNLSSFWLVGMMPVQLLLVLAVAFFAFIIGHHLLKKIGRPLPVIAQAALIWFTAYGILKIIVWPPLPSSLISIYMGLLTVVVFILISSTNRSWDEFKQTIMDTLLGKNRGYRIARAAIVFVLPLLAGILTYRFVNPAIEAPVELRTSHAASPAVITVYPPEYFMPKKS
ncbi:MAG TPA: hypothetical protein VLY20_01340 [Nitrospiria bacterium]|nr:hypothetical protein [Nitrospiria bacterium]